MFVYLTALAFSFLCVCFLYNFPHSFLLYYYYGAFVLSFLILYQCLWHFILRHVSLFMIGRAICIDPHVCTQQSYHEFPPPRERCPAAMDLWHYSKRHDEVLQVLEDFIRARLPPHFFITINASASYCFPSHITPTSLRPDIVWWREDLRELWLLELTISYESVVADARERKCSKYYDLVEAGRAAGYRCELITVDVGSRGMLSVADLESIQAAIDAPRREMVNLCLTIIRTTILQSFWIWDCRNYMV